MIRQASFFAAAFALVLAGPASAQQHPAVTPASCKAPVFPKAPSPGMTSEQLTELSKQFQATQKDGNARYINCASDADWSKHEKAVDAYSAKINAAINSFNKANSRPTTTPASCTPVKKLVVPSQPTREQLLALQEDLKAVVPDFNDRFSKCASVKDVNETKANIEKARADFDVAVKAMNADTEKKNEEIRKANEETLRQNEEAAKKNGGSTSDKNSSNDRANMGGNGSTRY